MNTVIGLLEIAGYVILLFVLGLLFARISGYGELYDKMLADIELEKRKKNIKNEKIQNINDEIFIH